MRKSARSHENGENMRYLFDLKALRSFHSIRDGKMKRLMKTDLFPRPTIISDEQFFPNEFPRTSI